jgi:hypothetical protein
MRFFDYLFVDNASQFILLVGIVLVASIIRGCIGFGSSALVIASTSFWLEIKYVAAMMIILEVSASFAMLKYVRSEIDYQVLKVLSITGVITSVVGVWALVNVDKTLHQILISAYLLVIVAIALTRFEFNTPINTRRLYFTGLVAGFYNGFAALGGVFVAAMLSSSRIQTKNIRATMVVYFFIIEIAFFIPAYLSGIYTREVFITGFILIIPMIVGIYLGSKLFVALPEKILKQVVLIALTVLSIVGILKVLL